MNQINDGGFTVETKDIMKILEDEMKVAMFATVDQEGQAHVRPITVGVANEEGVFFMTNPRTDFYKQLQANPNVAIAGLYQDDYLIQVIRLEGKVRELGRDGLEDILGSNPYIEQVYPKEADRQRVQVFQLYEGEGFYHSLTQGHRYTFEIGENDTRVL